MSSLQDQIMSNSEHKEEEEDEDDKQEKKDFDKHKFEIALNLSEDKVS